MVLFCGDVGAERNTADGCASDAAAATFDGDCARCCCRAAEAEPSAVIAMPLNRRREAGLLTSASACHIQFLHTIRDSSQSSRTARNGMHMTMHVNSNACAFSNADNMSPEE